MNKQALRLPAQGKWVEELKAWLIMLPGIILMCFFVWEPLLESIRMSLYKTENIELVEFVGFRNFVSVMGKSNFLQVLTNTFAYTFWSLLIGFFLPILLAMLIGETVRGKGFFRTAACRVGQLDRAWELFMKSASIDLEGGGKQWAGEIYIGGTHPASNGGAWMIAVLGFAGLRLERGRLTLSPRLPRQITRLRFPVTVRGERRQITVTHEGWTVT